MTVSYTHLTDLAQTFHENSIPAIIRWTEEHTEKVHRAAEKKFIPIPVSYTHLDVYKRQPLQRECAKWA